jgi:hypothetical protein
VQPLVPAEPGEPSGGENPLASEHTAPGCKVPNAIGAAAVATTEIKATTKAN